MSDASLPTTAELATLSALVEQWEQWQSILASANATAKDATAQIADIEINLIPSMMASAGAIERFDLADGKQVTLKDELFAGITQANQPAAFSWLEQHGHGDVIKDELKFALGRGETASARAAALISKAEAEGISDYSRKRAVHPSTLVALIREQLAEGIDVPKETFGVHQQRRAIIKLPKGAK